MNRSMLRKTDLDKHQKDAVWRIIQSHNTLLAHVVGAGIMPRAGLCRIEFASPK
jgi:N12 class adenine-specific DNA methylase